MEAQNENKKLFIWTDSQKSELILSVLKDSVIPPMTLISYEHEHYKVVDGKQRLGAMMGFVREEFPEVAHTSPIHTNEASAYFFFFEGTTTNYTHKYAIFMHVKTIIFFHNIKVCV